MGVVTVKYDCCEYCNIMFTNSESVVAAVVVVVGASVVRTTQEGGVQQSLVSSPESPNTLKYKKISSVLPQVFPLLFLSCQYDKLQSVARTTQGSSSLQSPQLTAKHLTVQTNQQFSATSLSITIFLASITSCSLCQDYTGGRGPVVFSLLS